MIMIAMQPFAPSARERVASTEQPSYRYATAPRVSLAQVAAPPRVGIIIPVANTPLGALADTWGHPRGEGRTHQGIDIMAPMGAPVLAAVDGRLVKFFDSERGGITIYQFDERERFVYYYAHLNGRAAGVAEGDVVQQGAVIGYVGMSGNAPVPHLHFEIQRLDARKRWWEAESIDPYPFLVSAQPPAG